MLGRNDATVTAENLMARSRAKQKKTVKTENRKGIRAKQSDRNSA